VPISAAEARPCCRSMALSPATQDHRAARRGHGGERGGDRGIARAEWRGQDHVATRNFRPAALGRRRGPLGGTDMRGAGPRESARAGLVHVIEGHRVFTQLSVTDNLLLAGYDLPRGERVARIDEALGYFPEIAAKRNDKGGALSGGQQQMLAVAQGLVRRPRLLMLDEPSAGLSPCWSIAC